MTITEIGNKRYTSPVTICDEDRPMLCRLVCTNMSDITHNTVFVQIAQKYDSVTKTWADCDVENGELDDTLESFDLGRDFGRADLQASINS